MDTPFDPRHSASAVRRSSRSVMTNWTTFIRPSVSATQRRSWVGPRSLPSAAEGVSDRLSELTPLPVVVDEARDVGQQPPNGSMVLLHRERNGSRPRKSAGQLGEDREVGVKPHALKPTDAQRR
jgi:hypothetical protein